jgi:hypothetical protein
MSVGGSCTDNVALHTFVKDRCHGERFCKSSHFRGVISAVHNNRKHSGVAVYKHRNVSL